jgi:hypothetical protein
VDKTSFELDNGIDLYLRLTPAIPIQKGIFVSK